METGGDLFGFWTHSGNPVIQYVLGPGKCSRHNSISFFQDEEHLNNARRILREKHGLQHIGAWHFHHQIGLTEPSSGDSLMLRNWYNYSIHGGMNTKYLDLYTDYLAVTFGYATATGLSNRP